MFFMGEKKLGKVPDDLDVYELVFQTGADPDRIREWSLEDRKWLKLIPIAKRLASEEIHRRGTE